MSDTYINWNKINLIKLEPNGSVTKPDFMSIITFEKNDSPSRHEINTQLIKHENSVIETKITVDDLGYINFLDFIPEDLFSNCLIESINDKKELLKCEGIEYTLKKMRSNLMLSMWNKGTIALLPETKYQFFNGNGSIMSENKTYGTFKGIDFIIPIERRPGYLQIPPTKLMKLRLSYAYVPKFPEKVNIKYVMEDNNIAIIIDNVELNEVEDDGNFKTFILETDIVSFKIKQLRNSNIIYPGQIQDVTDIPKVYHNDKRIARRLNSVVNLDSTDSKEIGIKTDTIRNRFKKLV